MKILVENTGGRDYSKKAMVGSLVGKKALIGRVFIREDICVRLE